MYFLYILRGVKDRLYIGVTHDIEKRIERHIKGFGAEFTKRNLVFTLVYQESYTTLLQARRRESQVKKWSRKKKENLIEFGRPTH